jgi:selenide, water dikinase
VRARAARSGSAPRHVLLLGGGHTHLHVLRSFAMKPPSAARITLLTPSAHTAYSGMVPGVLAGLYEPADCLIDVAALAARAGVDFIEDRAIAVDPDRRIVDAARVGPIPYDILSLDVGAQPRNVGDVSDRALVVPVKPVEALAEGVRSFLSAAAERRVVPRAIVVGAGAGGVELAFALRRRLAGIPESSVAIVERAGSLLPGRGKRLRALVSRLAARHAIHTYLEEPEIELEADGVRLADGRRLAAGLVVWATGAEGLAVVRNTGLPVDDLGFVLVDAHLRTISNPEIFAVGDCARMRDHPDVPRAGVFAVRQGAPLTHNLRAALAGSGKPVRYVPQADFLSLLSLGNRQAVVSYYGFAGHGRLWWHLKDWIDRRFVALHAPPSPARVRGPGDTGMDAGAEMAPCGGCAAKVDAATLETLLGGLAVGSSAEVLLGLAARDDAAVLRHPPGMDLVTTIDAFPPFFGDLYAVAEIAAVNAASDVFAMGGTPYAALLLVGSAFSAGAAREAELGLLMRGALAGLERLGTTLVGGHTLAAATPLVGFAMIGKVEPGATWTKSGAQPGDRLLLTKPLGTGVVFAATRAGECAPAWTSSALGSMRRSNGDAARVLRSLPVHACTDVTGFGLLGHLREMLVAGGVSARLEASRIPALPGALELLRAGWRSSADGSNRRFLAGTEPQRGPVDEDRRALLCDPQTSGGLLVAVAPGSVEQVVAELRAAGDDARSIGEILAGSPGEVVVD